MAYLSSYKLPLLAAAALVAPTVAAAQDTGTRIVVIGAMQETGTHITVLGAMQETGTHITVLGAARERAQTGEDPADAAIPALPVVYEDDGDAAAPASTASADKAPTAPAPGR
jgi:hypothetical protein